MSPRRHARPRAGVSRSRAARVALLLAGLAVAAPAGCGIPADDEPRAIAQDQRADSSDGSSDGSVDTTAGGVTDTAQLYFTRFDGDNTVMVPVEVPVLVDAATSTPDPANVLETLLTEQPSDLAPDPGLQTKIPPNTALASPPELDADGTLAVDLTSAIFDTQADGSRLAFGQIVCTADALPGVEAVRFLVDGRAQGVPMGDGESTDLPVTCASYANLLDDPAAAGDG
ncbi:MAG TPA: GerMN domain-containing protein [Acidimicrobiales bacterium]|nr:GerMN domain-containing protein [Acidimicrobiales bacterium]